MNEPNNPKLMTHIEDLVKDIMSMTSEMVIKRATLASVHETPQSSQDGQYYQLVSGGNDTFEDFISYDLALLMKIGLTEEEAKAGFLSKVNIPETHKDLAWKEIRKRYLHENYVEQNPYYRELNGQRPLGDTPIFVNPMDGIYGIPFNVPVDELSDMEIAHLYQSGYIDTLIKLNPGKKYLRFLGHKRVPILDARLAKPFDILRLGRANNPAYRDLFVKSYEYAKRYVLGSELNLSHVYGYQLEYEGAIGSTILSYAISMCLANSTDILNFKMYEDEDTINHVLASYALGNVFDDLPLRYRKVVSDNIERLIHHRGKDEVFKIIYDIFGFSEIEVYKYVILKTPESPDSDKDDLVMVAVNVDDSNPIETMSNPDNHLSYEALTRNDPKWGVYTTHEEVKQALLNKDFNYMDSKYISVSAALDISKTNYDINNLINSFLSNKDRLNMLFVHHRNTGRNFRLFDMIVGFFALICKSYDFAGNIHTDVSQVFDVYMFNTFATVEKVAELFDKYNVQDNPEDYMYNEDPVYFSDDGAFTEYFMDCLSKSDRLLTKVYEANDIHDYLLAKDLYDMLNTAKMQTSVYTMSNGNVANTYLEYLEVESPILADFVKSTTIRNARLYASELVDDIADSFEDELIASMLMSEGTGSVTMVIDYLTKIVDVFRSYTVTMDSSILMSVDITDPRKNSFRLMDSYSYILEPTRNSALLLGDELIQFYKNRVMIKSSFVLRDEIIRIY